MGVRDGLPRSDKGMFDRSTFRNTGFRFDTNGEAWEDIEIEPLQSRATQSNKKISYE